MIKPYHQELEPQDEQQQESEPIQSNDEQQPQPTQPNEIRRNPPRQIRRPRRFQHATNIIIHLSYVPQIPTPNFRAFRLNEIDGLFFREVFKIIPKENIPVGTRIFNSKFVDQVKNEGTEKTFKKSRLVI